MLQKVRKFFQHEVGVRPWHRYTPDAWMLEQHARQNVFVCDDMKTGHINHKLIEKHVPVHPLCYTLDEYIMWNKDLGTHSFPIIFDKTVKVHGPELYKPEPARIQGQLYSLPSTIFYKVLDIHKENTVKFIRRRVGITLPYRLVSYDKDRPLPVISKDYLRTVPAHMYLAIPEYWSDLIGCHLGSKATPLYQHETPKVWIDKYYKF